MRGLFSVVAIVHEMHGRRRAFDVMLRGRADSVMGAVQDAEDPEDNVTVDPTELVLPRQDVYEVLSPPGACLAIRRLPRPTRWPLWAHPEDGYFNFKVGGSRYRAMRLDGVRVIDREEQWRIAPAGHSPLRLAHPRPLA